MCAVFGCLATISYASGRFTPSCDEALSTAIPKTASFLLDRLRRRTRTTSHSSATDSILVADTAGYPYEVADSIGTRMPYTSEPDHQSMHALAEDS